MAAGRKSVLGKRGSYKYGSVDESDFYTKGFSGLEGDVFHGGKEDREEGEIFVEHVYGDEALSPPEKRRKCSAVESDLAQKEARVSTKSKVARITESLSRDGGVISAYSPNSSCVDDENDLYGWNITKSRWACEGLSPVGGDDDNYKQQKGSPGSLSPEIGECSDGTITSTDVDEQVSDSPSGSFGNSGTMHMQRNLNMCQSCRSVSEFEMIKKINEGTYGVVYKAKDKKTGEIVALKKVKMNLEKEGFPLSALREMNILLSLNHPSIVDVKEVVVDSDDDNDGTYMVMEHMQYDLKGLLEVKKHPFSMGEIKSLMLQLLEGVHYLHENWVLHRDLKTSNILLNEEGQLKICDFGMSRQYGSPLKPYTSLVVTLWYRAPELLLGAKEYSKAIDMWSLGCIMAELLAKEPLFRGKTELQQLDKIFRTLGTPDEKIWPGLSKLPGCKANFVKQPYNMLRKKFPATSFTGSPVLSELGLDFLNKLLTYDPEKRITAEAALLHDWFREAPLPKSNFKPIFKPWQC